MTALTKDTPFQEAVGRMRRRPVAAAVLIYDGSILGIGVGGYAKPFVLGDRFGGHALEGVDNTTGAAGDRDVQVRDGIYQAEVSLAGVAVANNFGRPIVYAQDSGTLSLTSGLKVGHVVQYLGTAKAIVEFDASYETAVVVDP